MDANVLIGLVADVLREHGIHAVYDDAGALVAGEVRFVLGPSAAVAAQAGRQSWPALVRRHVANMLAAHAEPEPETLEDARTLLLPKLRALSDLPQPRPAYVEELLPGVGVVAALDYPSHVAEVHSDDVITRLGGWETIREIAVTNLRSLPDPTISDLLGDPDRDDATVQVLMFEDFFGAARVLRLQELLSGIGIEQPRHGVLVALPHRHLIAVHVVRGEGVIPALRAMATLSLGEYRTGPGPISPHVYFCRALETRQQVTVLADGDDSLTVTLHGAFGQTLQELGLADQS